MASEVRQQLQLYLSLIKENKKTSTAWLILDDGPPAHKNYRLLACELAYEKGSKGVLKGRQSIRETHDYGFQILSDYFSKPIIRFDSDGPVHVNKVVYANIHDKRVPTPHYHKYDDNGIFMAYQTKSLIERKEDLLKDIQLGFSLFCHEFCTFSSNGNVPEIGYSTINFSQPKKDDPNEGVSFEV